MQGGWNDRFLHHIEIAENKVSDACRTVIKAGLKLFIAAFKAQRDVRQSELT